MLLLKDFRVAGKLALSIYKRDFDVTMKNDRTPVTEADLAVDKVIVAALENTYPDIPVVSEERPFDHVNKDNARRFFLVDPIDGTKEFIKKTDEFTINVAFIENGVPIAGVVYAPALGRLFIADVDGSVFELDEQDNKKPLNVRDCSRTDLVAVASRSHNTPETQAFLDKNKIEGCVNAGSSLKFCVVAAGEADIYPRFSPTMEWDTAAGHAVLRAAGGQVVNIDRSPLTYGKVDFRNPNFIAFSPQAAKRCPA
ncbi:MAG: 3'(2'),5'-bisphosphate nucleotidase CysQ [Pseudomonadota bacterium]